METINLTEAVIVNSIGIVLVTFLLITKIENKEKQFLGDRLFNIMLWIALVCCANETVTFLIDGVKFPGCRVIAYLTNMLSIVGSCFIAFIWSLYVENRVYNNDKRTKRRAIFLSVPMIINLLLNIINLSGCGLIFTISEANVYSRGSIITLVYMFFFFYFVYSICTVRMSKRNGLHIKFFPVYYFVIPCFAGSFIQGMMYGIALGWASTAIALVFVYIQEQSRKSYEDSLSGLYNRRYMEYILSQVRPGRTIYGIMMDANDFKKINDVYGHIAGDNAICNIGRIVTNTVPPKAISVRYAGDEFIVLMRGDNDQQIQDTIHKLNEHFEEFNNITKEPYRLSIAMGYSTYNVQTRDVDRFLAEMDKAMYDAKQEHYRKTGTDRRR